MIKMFSVRHGVGPVIMKLGLMQLKSTVLAFSFLDLLLYIMSVAETIHLPPHQSRKNNYM